MLGTRYLGKYEELVTKSLSSKNRSKELFGSIKNQGTSKERSRRQPFWKDPLFRSRGNRGRGIFTAAGQTLQQQYPTRGQGRGNNEFINSTFHQLDGPSFCISILQNTSTSSKFISGKNQATAQSRQSEHFVKNWQRLTNDPIILDIVNGYKIPFILPPRKSRLPNLCQLTKEASDLADQEVQDMLRKGAIVVSDLKGGQFLSSLFLVKKKDGQLGKLLKTTYRSSFRRAPSKKVSTRPSTYQKTRWSTF